ncbi:MAG: hypothetical protein ACR2NW_07310 [Thermodesulfobacteriota bacterium]
MSVQPGKKVFTIDDLGKDLLKTLERYEVKTTEFLKLKKQFATKTEDNYIIKMLLDSEARQWEVRGHLEEAITVYEKLSAFIAVEDRDNPLETLRSIHRLNLRQLSRIGTSKVRIKNCGEGGCKECKKLNGKIIDINEALKNMPLPHASCSFDLYRNGHSFCRCSYVAISDSFNLQSKRTNTNFSNFNNILIPISILIIIFSIILFYLNLYS